MKKNSDFVLKMDESVTLAAANRAKALKAQGRDIIDLTLGQPDFPTPKIINFINKPSKMKYYLYNSCSTSTGVSSRTARKNGYFSFIISNSGPFEISFALALTLKPIP